MKLYAGLVIAAMLMITSVRAQNSNMGIKGGLNFYNIYNENGSMYDTKIGFHAGLLWHTHMSQNFALQPEVVYSLQGARRSGNSNLNLGYLNVPVLFQLMFNNGFRLEAGPQIGFLVLAKSELSGTSEDVRNNFKPLDVALAFGFGFIGSSGLGFDARYNHGVNSINDAGVSTITNKGFQVGLFYQFQH
jgi:hypothetical protein